MSTARLLQVKLMSDTAILPTRGSAGASCFDLHSDSETVIEPGKTALIKTGISVSVPYGFEVQIRSRSGLALKKSIMCLNSPGTVDSDYRGEVGVILHNHGDEPFEVKRGDRIAQMGVYPVTMTDFDVVSELDATARGNGGFGSTGVSADVKPSYKLSMILLGEEESDKVVNEAERLDNIVSPVLLAQGSDNLPYLLQSGSNQYLFFPDGGVYGPYVGATNEQLIDLCEFIVKQARKDSNG